MKVLSWLVGLPLAVIVSLFALSNRHGVIVGLWPLEDGIELPVFLLVLLPLLAGLLAGMLFAGLKGLKHRRLARQQARRVADLERQLDAARASATTADIALPPLLSGDHSKTP